MCSQRGAVVFASVFSWLQVLWNSHSDLHQTGFRLSNWSYLMAFSISFLIWTHFIPSNITAGENGIPRIAGYEEHKSLSVWLEYCITMWWVEIVMTYNVPWCLMRISLVNDAKQNNENKDATNKIMLNQHQRRSVHCGKITFMLWLIQKFNNYMPHGLGVWLKL